MEPLPARQYSVTSPPGFRHEVSNVVAEFANGEDDAILAYLSYQQGAIEWGGILLQEIVPRDVTFHAPSPLVAKLVEHWDVLLWQATTCVAGIRMLPARKVETSAAMKGITQALIDLAASIWQLANHPLVADLEAKGPSRLLLPWFCSIPDEEYLWLKAAGTQGGYTARLDDVVFGGGIADYSFPPASPSF
jgi:hypothetical protein